MRAKVAFLVSASRQDGKNVCVQVESEKGGVCRLQPGMLIEDIQVYDLQGREKKFIVLSEETGTIEMQMKAGEVIQVLNGSISRSSRR